MLAAVTIALRQKRGKLKSTLNPNRSQVAAGRTFNLADLSRSLYKEYARTEVRDAPTSRDAEDRDPKLLRRESMTSSGCKHVGKASGTWRSLATTGSLSGHVRALSTPFSLRAAVLWADDETSFPD